MRGASVERSVSFLLSPFLAAALNFPRLFVRPESPLASTLQLALDMAWGDLL